MPWTPPWVSRRRFLESCSAAGGFAMLHPFSARAGAGQAHLRILATTDLHCHVQPYDYYADRPSDTLGLARTASLIETVRAEAANSLLVDNGDYLQGNPMSDYIAYQRGMKPGDIHPIVAGMNTLAFDAGTLGNHEFNYGVEFLDLVNAGADFPILCANFATRLGAGPRADRLHLKPYAILSRAILDGAGVRSALRVGLIGFVPPQVLVWDRSHLEGRFQARDILEAARAWTPEMREAGAEIVIALSHSGFAPGPDAAGLENAAFQLAGVEGIDAIVAGHQHRVWPGGDFAGEGFDPATGGVRGKPAVMAGFWGSHMGLIDLMLERGPDGWRVAAFETSARPIYRRNADRSVTALAGDFAPALAATAAIHAQTLAYARAPVGETSAPLQSYFATVSDDPSIRIVNQAQAWRVAQLLEGTRWEGLPILSAAAPFKAGGRGGPDHYTDVPAGPIAIRNVADVYLYPNTLQAVAITGAEVKEWLERSAGIFLQITPGAADQPFIDPSFPPYNFDVINGVTYLIDVTQPSKYDGDGRVANPEARRIVDLAWNGAPVDPAARFVVATNTYRAGGGGRFPGADGTTAILATPDANRDVIARYIAERGRISPAADGNWRFAPAGGASVLYDTGPGAAAHVADLRARGLVIEAAGDGPDGFARYRLTL